MCIKSLLLGAAVAALAAVSSAGAADIPAGAQAAPAADDQDSYVIDCGGGYFYIPGSKTCLRISGYVRFDADAGDALGIKGIDRRMFYDSSNPQGKLNDTWNLHTRFALRTATVSETELGPLRTYTEAYFQYDTNTAPYTITLPPLTPGGPPIVETYNSAWASSSNPTLNFAYIELGGLRLGKDETAFRTFLGYAGNVVNDDIIEPNGYDTMLISYTFTGKNGLSAILSLEQGSAEYTIDSYTPHIAGGVKYAQGWGSLGAVAGYDANFDAWAVKARADFNVHDTLSVFVMGGWRSDGDIENLNNNFYASWGGDWIGWAGASYLLTDKAIANLQVSFDDSKQLAVAANVAYQLVPGFTITPEVVYKKNSNEIQGNDDGIWGGTIRFQRAF
ncbi:porin [Phyllobacterium leguminum]|uniref:Porin n=1 Tax=Phyllobacterium leguminum TaxID=314237 RepID=A0A318T366_9HYPH|nr:porin [Phyllobacterium leguminum]PYE88422.1 porin-like protein [Phyllobacterium leguminum]